MKLKLRLKTKHVYFAKPNICNSYVQKIQFKTDVSRNPLQLISIISQWKINFSLGA